VPTVAKQISSILRKTGVESRRGLMSLSAVAGEDETRAAPSAPAPAVPE
jgi:hypothetical protein